VFWKKKTVEQAWRLDMARFAKDVQLDRAGSGYTAWRGNLGSETTIGWEVCPPHRLRLYYSVTKRDRNKVDYDYWVDLDTTPCYYGNKRWWFICPNTNCRRRCRILYMAPGSDYFLCRICQNLTYRSQQEGITRMGALCTLALDGPKLEQQLLKAKTDCQRQRIMQKFWRLHTKAQPLLNPRRRR
jgi:hypothetical protein